MGFLGDVGKAVGNVVKGGAQIVTGGAYNPNDGSWGTGNMRDSLGGLGGYATMLGMDGGNLLNGGGGLFGSAPKSGGGGGGIDAAAQAQIAAALAGADAAKYSADKQYALGMAGIDAQLEASRNSMMGGLLGAAMASQQDTTVRKQLLPHEAGAATIASWDIAQRWQKTLEMRVAGYSDTAIDYELQGRNWQAKWNSAEWNALQMMDLTKKDMLTSVQTFGIQSDSNPHGIAISEDEWMGMHAFKKPDDIMKVDPAEAAERNARYKQWQDQMRSSGQGLVVDLFENPQLAGSNIMTMKGKDPLIDPRLTPLLETMGSPNTARMQAQMDQELAAIDKTAPQWRHTSANSDPTKGFYFDAAGNMITDSVQGGRTLSAKDRYQAQMDKINKEKDAIRKRYGTLMGDANKQKTDWDAAIRALTKGEKNQYTDQITKLMEQGVIDKYGMVNAGALKNLIPQDLITSPQFSVKNFLSEQQMLSLKDQYNALSSKKVDEKLVRTESLGAGVTRKILLNPDGTKASSVMEGYMMDKMGNQHFVSMVGDRTQDFYDRASMISGFSPLSPGYRAPISQDMMAGGLTKRDNHNYLAKAATGQKGATTKPGQDSTMMQSNPTGGTNVLKLPAKPSNGPANPAQAVGGAPLAAGDD